jgi:hypothetical protein
MSNVKIQMPNEIQSSNVKSKTHQDLKLELLSFVIVLNFEL